MNSQAQDRQIVLVIPRLLGPSIDFQLFETLIDTNVSDLRCIMRADEQAEVAYAIIAARRGLTVEILSRAHLTPLANENLRFAEMLPGATQEDTDLFALSMCDTLLLPDESKAAAFYGELKKKSGRELKKPTIRIIGTSPAQVQMPRLSRLLTVDPRVARPLLGRTLRRGLEWVTGRIDPHAIQCASFWGNRFPGRKPERHNIRLSPFDYAVPTQNPIPDPDSPSQRCFAYFGPDGWEECVPDELRGPPHETELLQDFRVLDRGARFGAWLQRDIVWTTNLAAAFAVFAAVCGILGLNLASTGFGRFFARKMFEIDVDWGWTLLEVFCVATALIPVFFAWRVHLQGRWMACRLAAEQIRIGYMCLAVGILPPVLLLPDEGLDPADGDRENYRYSAVAMAKRLLRNHGLPRTDRRDLQSAINWVRMIVRDQFTYHSRNHRRLEEAEHGLNGWAILFSAAVVFAVCIHLFCQKYELLELVSAVGPALAAALHSIGTRLDIVHRSDLSADTAKRLAEVDHALAAIDPSKPDEAGAIFRDLTLQAAEAMNTETEQWHRLVLLQPLMATV
jgi:hypothetical protein